QGMAVSRLNLSMPTSPNMALLGASFLRPRALAPAVELHGAIWNGDAEGCAERPFDKPNLAAMGTHELGGDCEAEAAAASAVRSRKRLEQMFARVGGKPRPGVGNLDNYHGALAPPGDADLIARLVLRLARAERLH